RARSQRGAGRACLRPLPARASQGEGGSMTVGPRLSRRRLLRTAVLAGAAAAIGARRAAAQASPEWTALVAAAKKEGKVVVNTFPGDGYGRALNPLTQTYPDIKLEHTSLHSQDSAPR